MLLQYHLRDRKAAETRKWCRNHRATHVQPGNRELALRHERDEFVAEGAHGRIGTAESGSE